MLTNLFSEQSNFLIIVTKFYVFHKYIFFFCDPEKKINSKLVLTALH